MRAHLGLAVLALAFAGCTRQPVAPTPPPANLDEFLARELARIEAAPISVDHPDPDLRALGCALVGVHDVNGVKSAFREAAVQLRQRQWRRLIAAFPELADFRAMKSNRVKGSNGWAKIAAATDIAAKREDHCSEWLRGAQARAKGVEILAATADVPELLREALQADCLVWIPPPWREPIEVEGCFSGFNPLIRVMAFRIRAQDAKAAATELELLAEVFRRADAEGSMMSALLADVAVETLVSEVLLPTLESGAITTQMARIAVGAALAMPMSWSRVMFLEQASVLPLLTSSDTRSAVSLLGLFEKPGPTSLEGWLHHMRDEYAVVVDWWIWALKWIRQGGKEISDAEQFSRLLAERPCPMILMRNKIHSRLLSQAHLLGVELRALETESGPLPLQKKQVETLVAQVRGLDLIWHTDAIELSPSTAYGIPADQPRNSFKLTLLRK